MSGPGVFVGRAAELTAMLDALEAAVEGRTSTVLVAGEPGMGKTRLLEELERMAGARAVPVLWGRATSEAGAPAFWPWRQVLRSWLSSVDPDRAAVVLGDAASDLARIAPELASVGAPRIDRAADLLGDAEQRFALFETAALFLARAAVADGLVVVIDDLHWADPTSVLLLGHLVRNVRAARLLVVTAFRPVELAEVGHAVEVVAQIAGESAVRRIDLAGLSTEEVGAQLAHVLGRAPDGELVATVAARTAGNPLFVQEVGRLIAAGAEGVPAAVRSAIGQRLGHLDPRARELLAAAAVVGPDIDPALVATVTGLDVEAVLGHLESAVGLGLAIRPRTTVGCRFAHDLIRECCALESAASERSRLHLAVADELERVGAEERLGEIAHHLVAALPVGDANRAARAAIGAAEQAMAQLAYEEAARLYGSALDATAADPDGGARARLLVEAARAHHLANDSVAAMSACEQAAALAERNGDAETLARAALVLEDTSEPHWLSTVAAWCRAALDALPADDSALRARLLAQDGVASMLTGDVDRMLSISAEALAMAERLDDPGALATALRARQLARSSPDGVHERLALADRMHALGDVTGNLREVMWGHLWRFDALVQLGRIDEAEAEVDRLEPIVDRSRERLARWHLLRSRTAVHIARGRFAAALATDDEATALAQRSGLEGAVLASVAVKLIVSALTGESLIDPDGVPVAAAPPVFLAIACTNVAERQLAFGQRDDALRLYRLAAPSFRSLPPFLAMAVGAMRGALAAALGDGDEADATYRSLLPYADLHVTGGAGAVVTRGSVQHFLGVTAAGCGRLDDAVDHLRAAAAANSASGLPPFAAESLCCLAETLVRRQERADAREAAVVAAEAKAIADRLGMRFVSQRADAALAGLGTDRGTGPLSAREREIAGLVADGLTNRQIATALHIAERTAENHVQHILTKLGFNTRSQIAAWAASARTATPPA